MTHVVGKTTEYYDKMRLERAVQRALTANRTLHGDAANCAGRVIAQIERWLGDKTEITSRELRLQTAVALSDYDPDTANYYLTEKMLF